MDAEERRQTTVDEHYGLRGGWRWTWANVWLHLRAL
jgi:hypothetical protein